MIGKLQSSSVSMSVKKNIVSQAVQGGMLVREDLHSRRKRKKRRLRRDELRRARELEQGRISNGI
jgi:hypothetical protein